MSYALNVIKNRPNYAWILSSDNNMVELTGKNPGYPTFGSTTNATLTNSANLGPGLVCGASNSLMFNSSVKATFPACNFVAGSEIMPFALEAWVYPINTGGTWAYQQILGHADINDGIAIQGTIVTFITKYDDEVDCVCSYDLQTIRKAHIVGVHTATANKLYVDGKLVDTEPITRAQQETSYPDKVTSNLVSGTCTNANQSIVVNGVAIYDVIADDAIQSNYLYGNRAIEQKDVGLINNGEIINISKLASAGTSSQTWSQKKEFIRGRLDNVSVANENLYPLVEDDGSHLEGNWYTAFSLYGLAANIYGVMLEWSGTNIEVYSSLDGVNWTLASNGQLVSTISQGFSTSFQTFHIKVRFLPGAQSDSTLESISAYGYSDNKVLSPTARTVQITYPAVLRDDYEPMLYRDTNGVRLFGGSLTISASSAADAGTYGTCEVWIKPIDTVTISGGWNSFSNNTNNSGSLQLNKGRWQLLHLRNTSPANEEIKFTGDCIVGQVVFYKAQLSDATIKQIYGSYTGYPVIVAQIDSTAIKPVEQSQPASLYSHAWSEIGVS